MLKTKKTYILIFGLFLVFFFWCAFERLVINVRIIQFFSEIPEKSIKYLAKIPHISSSVLFYFVWVRENLNNKQQDNKIQIYLRRN
jgi:hypothetical protein